MLIAALGWQFQAFLAGFESFRSPLHGPAARVLGYNHWIRVARCSTVIPPSILRRFPRFEGSGSTNESDRDEVRTRERRTAGEQVDVAIFGDHVLRIEPQWLWEVDSTLFFTLSLSLPLPLVHTARYRCSILFLHGYQEFCKATEKKQSYLYFFFCDLFTLCTFPCSLSFLYLFSCTRDLFVSFVYVFFFLFRIFFFFLRRRCLWDG